MVCVLLEKCQRYRDGSRIGTVVSFVPTLFGSFLEIPSLYVFSFKKKNCDLFQLFFGGRWRGYRAILIPDMHSAMYIYTCSNSGDRLDDS